MKELTPEERSDCLLDYEKLKSLADRIIQYDLGKLTVGNFTDYRKMDLLNKSMTFDVRFKFFWIQDNVMDLTNRIAQANMYEQRDSAYRYRQLEDLQWQRYQLAVDYARDRRIIV